MKKPASSGKTAQIVTQNTLFIVSAPSGAGKSSLLQALLAVDTQLSLSISHTTRVKRPQEQDGVHYHYISLTEFEQLQQQGAFLESAEVFGHWYGTAQVALQQQLLTQDVALEIDWQGARLVRARFPQAVSVFIAPPSIQALEDRLIQRGQDSHQVIQRRMQAAQAELSHCNEYDYLLINDDFADTLANLQHIVAAERLRFARAMSQRRCEMLDGLY
jgi:guanylate kinase